MELPIPNLSAPSTPDNLTPNKLIILGSGPAGLSAALYAARAELNPLVFTGLFPGGQVALTTAIENYPGFPEGISGAKLGEYFQQQAERFGARIEFDTVTGVDLSTHPYRVQTYSSTYLTESLIIATGARPNQLNVPGEKELTGKGVSYCATCDGWFFKEKRVAVVGGGDSALEESLFLTRYASSVTIIHRRDTLRAGATLQRRAKENPKINIIWNSVVEEIIGQDAVQGVMLNNNKTGEKTIYATDGIFIFIGHTPNTTLFTGQLELDKQGYIRINNNYSTRKPGVFAAGEVADSHYRQVITSAGMGAAAAIEAVQYLEAA